MQNNIEADGPVIPPVQENGAQYEYCMYFNGLSEVAFADNMIELYDALIPGYSKLSEEEQILALIRLAAAVSAQTQAEILADVDQTQISEKDWNILTAPRSLPQPEVALWANEIPLVTYETAYEPFTSIPKPASALNGTSDAENLWILRNAEEDNFLISLHEVGYIRLLINELDEV